MVLYGFNSSHVWLTAISGMMCVVDLPFCYTVWFHFSLYGCKVWLMAKSGMMYVVDQSRIEERFGYS